MLCSVAKNKGEELWEYAENKDTVFCSSWPIYDESKLNKNTINIAIQVNGKLRATLEIGQDTSKEEIIELCKNNENVSKFISEKEIVREIYVPNKIVNIVIR